MDNPIQTLSALITLLFSASLLATSPTTAFTEAPPTAAFTANASSGSAPFAVSFNATSSSDSDGTVVGYDWDFGDGTSGSGQFTNKTYNTPGNYDVSLVVTDNDGEMSAPFMLTITVTAAQDPPVLDPIGDLVAIPGGPTFVTITATDLQAGDVLSFSAFDLPAFATLTDNGDRTATLTMNPAQGDVDTYPGVNIVVSDGNANDDEFLTITVPEICLPISTLSCTDVAVALPLNLTFDGTEGGLVDGDGDAAGFTMVDAPSTNQFPATPTYPAVPGYEPDLLDVSSGQLIVSSTKGIAYERPPVSSDNNTQVNALGAGFAAPGSVYNVSVDLAQPAFSQSAGNNSQQAGLWFGLNEDNYAKLAVIKVSDNNQRIELALEQTDPNDANAVVITNLSTGNLPTTAADINLRLEVDPVYGKIRGYYSIDGGAEVQIVDGADEALELPTAFQAGTDHDAAGGTPALTYAGIYTTHRMADAAESLDYIFDDFGIEVAPFTPTLIFDPNPFDFTLEEGNTPEDEIIHLFTNDGTAPAITLTDDPSSIAWLDMPQNPAVGDLVFKAKPGLDAGTYSTTIFALANGYVSAEMPVTLIVTAPQDVPRITGTFPTDGATNVSLNTSVSANELYLPNGLNGIFGVENSTITNQSVKLIKISTGTEIPATVNGTGGGDGINLTPLIPLEINTQYRYIVDGVKDLTGVTFEYFESTFTTAADNTGSGNDLNNVSFTRIGDVATGAMYASLTVGPDGKLYGMRIGGEVDRWVINADGTLGNQETITTLPNIYGARAAIGFAFDPDATGANLIAYVSHAEGVLNNGSPWDGKISRLTGANLQTEDLLVTNLPRSRRDHLTNSIAFRQGESNVLYFNQGSNTAGGDPDNSWGNRRERLLTAATLRLDLDLLPEAGWPLDAKTTMDQAAINNVDVNSPTLGTGTGTYDESNGTFPDDGTYNPFYINAPLTIFATGIRNAFDLVWHSNGQLYIPNNGTAGGSNTPASVDGTRRIDGTIYDHDDPSNDYPAVPATTNNNTQRDFLFRVDPTTSAGYYGHPNPLRGEFILNRGPVDVSGYDNSVSTDVNFRGIAFDFEFNKSPNGIIEYQSNAEGGALQGALLVCRYSGGSDIIALVPNGPNGDILTSRIGIPGFSGFQDPLDIAENPANGNLYVSDFGRQSIVLLKPSQQSSPEPALQLIPGEVVLDDIVDGNPTAPRTVFLTNTGNAALLNPIATVVGSDAGAFMLDATGLPVSLDPGQTVSITVALNASSEGPKLADLSVTGDNAVAAVTIDLRGLGKDGIGGSNEPSLQYIFDTYGLPISVGDQDVTTNLIELGNGLSYNDVLGDEADFQRFQAATDAPVEIEVISVFGPEAANPITGFGWYNVEDPATTNELFTLQNTTGNGQTLNPIVSGSLSFDPGGEVFGFYSRWPFFNDRRVNLEDALNTFPGAIPNHVRVYEIPGQDNVYVLAFEEHISGFDYQDIVIIVRNVEPVIFSPEPFLTAEPEELTFQAIVLEQSRETETKSVTITNTGASDLIITDVQLTGLNADHYSFVGPSSLTLAPAAAQTYSITFSPPLTTMNLGYKEAALSFTSNAVNAPDFDLGLYGLKQRSQGGGGEPPLQDIVDVLGYNIDVGWTTLNNTTDATLQGQEVAEPLFEVAGPGPVTITAVARFSPNDLLPFGWYSNIEGEVDIHQVGELADGPENVQMLYPPQVSGTNTFDPNGLFFGIYARKNNSFFYTEDQLNNNVPHRARVYPARNRQGVLLENSYLIGFEEAVNGDYQDYVFLITNAKPYLPPPPTLSFDPDQLEVFSPLGEVSDDYQTLLAANVTIANEDVTLTASEDWVILPESFVVGQMINIAVDAANLPIGIHEATVIAAAPGTVSGILNVTALVVEQEEGSVRINFQDDAFTPPASYLADEGAAYGVRNGGLSYGWIDPITKQPLNNFAFAVGDERGLTDQSSDTDKLLRSHNNLNAVGQNQPRDWEIELTDGTYFVEVGVGDPEAFNSQHVIRAEGEILIDNFIPTAQATLSIGQDTVTVTDGRLTIDDVGAPNTGNTKLVYLDVFPIDSSAFPPSITIELFGNQELDGDFLNEVEVSLAAMDHSGSQTIQSIEYSFDGVNYTLYDASFSITIDPMESATDYLLRVRATDGFGNVKNTTENFRIVSPTGAIVRLENMTKVPDTDRSFPADNFFGFSAVGQPFSERVDTALTYDENILRIHNDGTGTLLITKLTTTDTNSFVVRDLQIPPQGLPVEVGAFVDAKLVFKNIGGDRRVVTENLVIETNADNALMTEATLRGGFSRRLEGSSELTSQQVFEATGFSTEMGRFPNGNFIVYPSSDFPTAEAVNSGAEGDLILPGLFVQADPSQPVRMFSLAAFHGPGGASYRLTEADGGSTGISFNHSSAYFQSILPYRTAAENEIAGDWVNTIDEPFYVRIANYRSTGGNSRGQLANDILGVRIYRAIDQDGNTIPNEYIAIQDYIGNGCSQGSGNCDWNDNVAYLVNVRPQALPSAGSIADLNVNVLNPTTYDVSTYFDIGYPGNRLTYTATMAGGAPLLPWISLDPTTGEFTVEAPFAAANTNHQVTVTATDYNQISVITTFNLNVNPTDISCTVDANTDGLPKIVDCNNPSVQLLGSVDEGNPVWTGPGNFTSNLSSPVVTEAGTYTLMSDDPNCPLTSTIEVTMGPDFPGSTITGPDTLLTCTVGFIELQANSVDPAATFAWYDAADQLLGTNNTLIVTLPGTYRLEATNNDGCVSFASTNIVEDLTPASAGLDGNWTVCGSDDPFSLYEVLADFGGAPEDDGAWYFNDNLVSDQQDPATAQEGEYKYVVGGERGCAYDTASIILTITTPDIYYADIDRDGLGDPNSFIYACVLPADFVSNDDDNCPTVNSLNLVDADGDGQGDVCDPDDDNDGVLDFEDCDPFDENIGAPTFYYADFDEDGFGDPNNGFSTCALPPNGYILDNTDNCPNTPNPNQIDSDGDGVGDVCDPSSTGSTIFWLEAECGEIGDNWSVLTDTSASKGEYAVYTGSGSNLAPPEDVPANQIRFSLADVQPGNYYIFGRIFAPSVGSDSYWIRINGGEWFRWFRDIPLGAWEWNEMPDGPFALSDGTNTIDFAYREAGTRLDKLYLSLDQSPPTGKGEEGSNCGLAENVLPVALGSVNPTNGIAPLFVAFNARDSYDPDGIIANFLWDWGFGSSNDVNPTVEFPQGSYNVTLTVTDDRNGTDAKIFNVTSLSENGDADGDGIDNIEDTCPLIPNPGQNIFTFYEDADDDDLGDPDNFTEGCDPPPGYVTNANDNCPEVSSSDFTDTDNDGMGNACDDDDDGDGLIDGEDCDPLDPMVTVPRIFYADFDGDGFGDPNMSVSACMPPENYVMNNTDNCPNTANPGQLDNDGDGVGNACDNSVLGLSEFSLEAECALVGSNWNFENTASASNGQSVVFPSGNSYNSPPADIAANRIRFIVQDVQPGSYHLFARVRATNSRNNSFWIRVNGGDWIRWWSGFILDNAYNWNEALNSPFNLLDGENVVDFAYREDGTFLDKIYLSPNGNTPSGTGPVATNCSTIPNDPPVAVASASPDNGVAHLDVTLDGSASSDLDGAIVAFEWDWGSGSASGPSPTVTFFDEGTYNVTLTVTDDDGATDTDEVSISVIASTTDTDGDGVVDIEDNCPTVFNPDQSLLTFYSDADADGFGDPNDFIEACEAPTGYVSNTDDNCPTIGSFNLVDTDGDGEGNICDDDDDGDGIPDIEDCDPLDDQILDGDLYYADFDGDGFGDPNDFLRACSQPNDYVVDNTDNCPDIANPNQTDTDMDGIGDLCDGTISGVTTFALETECAEVGSAWTEGVDPNASNGLYLVRIGSEAKPAPPADLPENRIRFTVDNVQAGDYHIFARVFGATSSDDSYWVRINGSDWVLNGNNFSAYGSYVWNEFTQSPISLVEGTNVIDISFRENGAQLDKIYITPENIMPVGFGETALNCDGQLNDPPVAVATATPTEGITPLNVQLDGTASTDSDGTITAYDWVWSGGSATGVTPQIDLIQPGVYDVTLTVTDERGGTGTDVVSITVNEPPNQPPVASATATPANGAAPLATTLDGTASTDSDGSIVSYDWTWTGGGSASGATVQETFTLGVYDVTLTVTDDDGATATDVIVVDAFNGAADSDGDGIADGNDNCPTVFNPNQDMTTFYADLDGDGLGDPNNSIDACEAPADYVLDDTDNCPDFASTDVTDSDNDGEGDVCDDDDDNDGVPDAMDCDPLDDQVGAIVVYYADSDGDNLGDPQDSIFSCSPPAGYVLDNTDNCPLVANPNQEDADGDGTGDACDASPNGENAFWLEAECAEVGAGWSIINDPNASESNYVVRVSGNSGAAPPPDEPENRIRFILDSAQPGDYAVHARILAANGSDDSFWVRVNGGEWMRWFQGLVTGTDYDWRLMIGSPYALTDGINTIDIAFREDGARVDKLYVTAMGDTPSGFGDVAGNCTGGINQLPVAVAAADVTTGFAPLAVALDGTGSYDVDGSIISYNWSWSAGTASGATTNIQLATPGDYVVTLTVTDDSGGTDMDTLSVTVEEAPNQPPVAVATATPNSGEAPLVVQLDASGSSDNDGNIVSYDWDWGTGTASGINPQETFALGNYSVTLTVTDNEGATDTDIITIDAVDGSADTDGDGISDLNDNCPTVFNPNQSLFTFYADTDGDGFGDPNDSVMACEAPAGYVADNTDNCPMLANPDQTDFDQDGIGDACDDDILGVTTYWLEAECAEVGSGWTEGADAGASGSAYVVFPTGTSTGAAPADLPENRVRFTIDNTQGGDFHLFARVRAANNTDDSFWGRVNGGDWIRWGNDFTLGPDFVWAKMSSGPFALENGMNTIDFAYREDGAQLDKIYLGGSEMTPTGLGESSINCINAEPEAVAAATPTSGIAPLTVDLDGSGSTDEDGTIIDYAWDWGTGSATGAMPQVILTDVGTYDITLTVTDDLGAMGTDVVTVTVNEPPNQAPVAAATATPSSGEAPLTVQFDASGSTDADGTIVSYAWDWGTGTTTGVNPQETFAVGNYAVTLTVTDDDGATDMTVLTVDALDGSADTDGDGIFDLNDNCPTVFNPSQDLSTFYADADGDGFGDPNDSVMDCTAPAGYVVDNTDNCPAVSNPDQTDTDNDGEGDACDTDDDGDGVPDTEDCFPLDDTAFAGTTFYSDTDGDGFGDPNDSVTACEAPSGYVADNTDNCPMVANPDQADFDMDGIGDACDDETIGVNAFWLEAECADVGSGWAEVDDAAASNGKYVVFPTGTSTGSAPADIPENQVSFTVENVQAGDYHLFARVRAARNSDDSFWGRVNGGDWIRWGNNFPLGPDFVWTEVDDSPFTLIDGLNTIDFAYREDGAELDKLFLAFTDVSPVGVGEDAINCFNDLPVALATATPESGITPLAIDLDGSGSTDADGTIVSYDWDWGTGTITGATPQVVLTDIGVYDITLTVTDDLGGTGTDVVTVTVNEPPNQAPTAVAAATPASGAGPLSVDLDGSGSTDSDGTVVSYDWNWGSGSTTGVNPNVIFPIGNYAVTLTVTDDDGATATDVINIDAFDVMADTDGDGIFDVDDNCPTVANPSQNLFTFYEDADGDGFGDPAVSVQDCEAPAGFVANDSDNCPSVNSADLMDTDNDGEGDVCDPDDDDDGILDGEDCDPLDDQIGAAQTYFADLDGDGFGDPNDSLVVCTQPVDYVVDNTDNCPTDANADQMDSDDDGLGDVCDPAIFSVFDFWLEAECALVGSGWAISPDAAASNGEYVAFAGARHTGEPAANDPAQEVSFTVDITDAADYHLYFLLNAPNNSANSLWVQVDGGNWIKFWKEVGGANLLTTGFEWKKVANDGADVILPLTPGSHTIIIHNRETGCQVDKIHLGADAVLPTGFGDPADNCAAASVRQEVTEGNSSLQPTEVRETTTTGPVLDVITEPSIRLFPNPANDHLNFRLNSDFRGVTEAVILDLRGRVVATHRYDKRVDRLEDRLEVSDLPAGTYLLRVTEGDRHLNRKFVKLP